MSQKQIDITDSEWEVMRVIWAQGRTTSQEIVAILEKKMNWRPTTTKTLLARLVKKELVSTESEGNRYIYAPLVTESESWRSASSALFGHICAQKLGKEIASFLEGVTLSHEDVALFQALIDKKRAEAVDVVPCDCVPGQCNCEPGCCDAQRLHTEEVN